MPDRDTGYWPRTEHGAGLIAARRQKRIREQLRDAVDQAKVLDAGMERDKRRSSIRQFLAIDEVEALLDYIEGLERDRTRLRARIRELDAELQEALGA